MPEGDTIHRAARRMHEALSGSVVAGFRSVLPQLTRVHDNDPDHRTPDRSCAICGGTSDHRPFERVHLRTHMRMNGSWHLYRPDEKWRGRAVDVRIVISTDSFVAVGFSIPVAEFLTDSALARQDDLLKIGPDVLAPRIDRRCSERGFAHVQRWGLPMLCSINVWWPASETSSSRRSSSYRGQPFVLVGDIDDTALQQDSFERTEVDACECGHGEPGERTVDNRPAQSAGEALGVQPGRKPCLRCGTGIEYRKQGKDARGTYWCPRCQPASLDLQ